MSRTFAVGDVHGCDVALETLLTTLDLREGESLVQLGDLCDRGPDTARAIDLLIALGEEIDLHVILGNHDEMFLGALGRPGFRNFGANWEAFGGKETLASYGGSPKDVPEEHLRFLESARTIVERGSDIFVHAMIEPALPLSEQEGHILRWEKLTYDEPPPPNGRRVVCGHTAQSSGEPRVWPGWCCIDTKVYAPDGWITALEISPDGNDRIWQANQRGDARGPFDLARFEDRG
ncbi:metallophosphoesterase [Alienimonas chondri]|uniref:Bis(5'-nucleosyl)-tetraphosphatase, symmetrical n=1 Tax=Alienimonas chondri TaxID=2681879 RepID=A0ABX1VCU6_9PLAN|nr:metallophosphoesterase [Alienimonas chondri]NNJ25593.1 Bis(5'-nucleosyl)-tetraphosphatase, symmetrical [Alienimonas chondri]